MSIIFDRLRPLGNQILTKLSNKGGALSGWEYNNEWWFNKTFATFSYRKASLQILDKRDKNIWVLHLSIFPHLDDSAPILGFDIVATGNKITAVFCDFSITTNPNHNLVKWFEEKTKNIIWKKERELPEWGKQIFSKNMIAATAVNTEDEIDQVIDIGLQCLDQYLFVVGDNCLPDEGIGEVKAAQNKYCFYQKQNTFPVKMLVNYGLTEQQAKDYFDKYLYPEIP